MNPIPPQTALLGLGSNLGDRAAHLRAACAALGSLTGCSELVASPVYETPPMGPQDQGCYLNMVVSLQTTLAPRELLEALHGIEADLGRAPRQDRRHWGPREIDIDLLLLGDTVIDEPGLTVPHPGMAERWFVLKPLADLAPDAVHPVLSKTVAELLAAVEVSN